MPSCTLSVAPLAETMALVVVLVLVLVVVVVVPMRWRRGSYS